MTLHPDTLLPSNETAEGINARLANPKPQFAWQVPEMMEKMAALMERSVAGTLPGRDIFMRMRDAIGIYKYRRTHAGENGADTPGPKYIYLGREEYVALRSHCAGDMHETAADISGGKRTFMGVEVVAVDKESHLAVGE